MVDEKDAPLKVAATGRDAEPDKPLSPADPITNRSARDPHNVPVSFVNILGSWGFHDGVGNITLLVSQHTPADDLDRDVTDIVVAARLRFGVVFATQLRDTLNQILLAAAPTGQDKPS